MQVCLEHKTGTTHSLPEHFEDIFFRLLAGYVHKESLHHQFISRNVCTFVEGFTQIRNDCR